MEYLGQQNKESTTKRIHQGLLFFSFSSSLSCSQPFSSFSLACSCYLRGVSSSREDFILHEAIATNPAALLNGSFEVTDLHLVTGTLEAEDAAKIRQK